MALRSGDVLLFVRLFVCRQRVVVGHWLLLAATRGRSDARTYVSYPVKLLPPVNFMLVAGAYSWRHTCIMHCSILSGGSVSVAYR